MARSQGLAISSRVPYLVAGAMLRECLAEQLGEAVREAGDRRLEYLSDLCHEQGLEPPQATSAAVVDAWIEHLLAKRTLAALRELRPTQGDVVALSSRYGGAAERLRIVSSIDREGRVHLRGRGQRAWPDSLELVCRASDTGREADEIRRRAREESENQARTALAHEGVSAAKARRLSQWLIRPRDATEREIDALQGTVETAPDERPIQVHLEANPHLLAGMLSGGHGRWVRPQVSLGGEVVADFFIADADSTGIRWRLIELESPTAREQIKSGEFAKEARHAIHQIEHWRSWLAANSDVAHRDRREHGLQLVDIDPGAPALILIGRRHHSTIHDPVWKRRMLSGRGIEMHSYDWLLERVGHTGPLGGWML